MTPKTERFEMRIDPEFAERIDAWREGTGLSRSDAVRLLVEDGLKGTNSDLKPDGYQRLSLWLLAEILKSVRQDDDNTVRLIQEAIYGGHFWALNWQFSGILHNEMDTKSELSFVVDVLDMWDFIEISYDRLSDEEKTLLEQQAGIFGKNPKFYGFDGNNETRLMSIASFLINELGRFKTFKDHYLNAHSPKSQIYRNMLRTFTPIRRHLDGVTLSVEQLVAILRQG